MKITLADLWRPGGTIDRGPYALVGLIGFALKHNLDRLVAAFVFHRPWTLFNYWVPVRNAARITALGGADAVFLATMVAMALPFVWVGVTLTSKRLRSANLPPALVILFFVPFLNLLFLLFVLFDTCPEFGRRGTSDNRNEKHVLRPNNPWERLGQRCIFSLGYSAGWTGNGGNRRRGIEVLMAGDYSWLCPSPWDSPQL